MLYDPDKNKPNGDKPTAIIAFVVILSLLVLAFVVGPTETWEIGNLPPGTL